MRLLLPLIVGCAPEPQPVSGPLRSRPVAADSGAHDAAPLSLSLPLVERDRFQTVVGVDHDPEISDGSGLGRLTCLDHQSRGFPYCYDEHDGTDYILRGGFDAMDRDSPTIHAAAAGVVVEVVDGYYDRCHGSLETGDVDCDGHEMRSNKVILEHEGGWRSWYLHMQKGSVTVELDQVVEAGDVLGRVGSSGRSSMPHLHLEIVDPEGFVVDPYAGELSQDVSFWCEQDAGDGLPGDCQDG